MQTPFDGKNYRNGAARKRKTDMAELCHDGGRRRRLWRLRRAAKVVVRWSPKRLWRRLRDGYVNAMTRVARLGVSGEGVEGPFLLVAEKAWPAGKSKAPSKKRVEKLESMLAVEIYKVLATTRGVAEHMGCH